MFYNSWVKYNQSCFQQIHWEDWDTAYTKEQVFIYSLYIGLTPVYLNWSPRNLKIFFEMEVLYSQSAYSSQKISQLSVSDQPDGPIPFIIVLTEAVWSLVIQPISVTVYLSFSSRTKDMSWKRFISNVKKKNKQRYYHRWHFCNWTNFCDWKFFFSILKEILLTKIWILVVL